MKNIFITTLLFLYSIVATSQSVEEIKADQKKYIWGEGTGSTLNRADQEALAMLITQISAQVESNFTLLQEEIRSGEKNSFKEVFNGVINTYSAATLRNTERILIGNEPSARIFRYILRSEIDKIFKDRELKILDFTLSAKQYENIGEVSYALRYYYWALTLLRSHPDANKISIKDDNGNNRPLVTWIPIQINRIFSGIRISVKKSEYDDNLLRKIIEINYLEKPVKSLDYCYWTGRDWTNIYSAKDGIGIVEFTGIDNLEDIRLKVEYIYEGEAVIDSELKDVLSKIDIIPFRSCYINIVANTHNMPVNTIPKEITSSTNEYNKKTNFSKLELSDDYRKYLETIIQAINSKKYELVRSLFTEEGYDRFTMLINYGNARIVDENDLKFLKYGENVICRSLKMNFSFKNNNRNFIEDVVFNFNKDKKISNISFGLSQQAINDIMSKEMWSDNVRMIIIDFLENYKTAYALKRTDYIESIFADDALIIVGSVLKANPSGDNPFKSNQIVRYNRYSKEQYIKNLRHSFASNEFINVRFEDNTITKSGKGGEVYGVQIKQNYFSSSYGDSGYLFLLIDINNPLLPLIHVRTWQPQKNIDGSIYGLGDF